MISKKRLVAVLVLLVAVAVAAAVFSYEPLWQKISSFRPWSFGLDLAGGSLLTYEVDLSKIGPADRDSVVSGLRDVIEKRVNLFGVSEPRVFVEKSGESTRLAVELAGIKDIDEAIKEIGATPFLDFREVIAPPAGSLEASSTIQFIPTELNGRYIVSAQISFDSVTRQPQVDIAFSSAGADIFAELTGKNVGKPLAIFLDNQLIEMPTVQQKITGGKAQISGNFTINTARQLAERFNAGALPAPITLVNQRTVSSDFGKEAFDKAVFAGIIGTLAIILFMIIYYRGLGIFAAFALLMYVALTLAVFKIVPITMTLSGIAGFILSIGMAVDANILVFERTKEELKKVYPIIPPLRRVSAGPGLLSGIPTSRPSSQRSSFIILPLASCAASLSLF